MFIKHFECHIIISIVGYYDYKIIITLQICLQKMSSVHKLLVAYFLKWIYFVQLEPTNCWKENEFRLQF